MNREELIHVAVCQWLLVLAAVVSSAFFGWNAALSAAAGGVCVAIPNSLVVMNLLVSDAMKRPVAPKSMSSRYLTKYALIVASLLDLLCEGEREA